MSADVDVIVVGAGVVGLAIARALAMSGREVIVIEKANTIGTATSSRNSEVIHAGIYYPTNSLKAQFCVEGRQLLYEFCASHGVAARRAGKLIVATNDNDEAKLHAIKAQATANGVDDLEWLSAEQVSILEPEVRCTAALFSPSTGILDVQGFMLALQASAESHGASFAFRSEFSGAEKSYELFGVLVSGTNGEASTISCKTLVNCAGHGAHAVARAISGFDTTQLPPRFLAKGSYCSLSGNAPFSHLIYPVPVAGALGIHATLDMTGAVRFGPDIQWVDTLDYGLQQGLPHKFVEAVAAYWPDVITRNLTPSYCGIRPKIHGPDKGFADFIIQFQNQHGVAGLVNLFGIESPGITASLAMANHLVAGLGEFSPR
jgi:L-2-hydroxyglutarate oxidase LhgO